VERIGVRELRQHASRYLDMVKAGETVEVTERGRLVALLVPPTPQQDARDRLIAEGRLIPAKKPGGLASVPPPLDGSFDTAAILDELRADRL
jgi:prevent-host-death family protein